MLVLSIIYPLLKSQNGYHPQAENGVLNLSHWNPELDGKVMLDGQWSFYWERLLTPADFAVSTGSAPAASGLIEVPSSWDTLTLDGAKLPIYGYATYRLKIIMPVNHGTFGIKTTNIRASNRIFVNGEEIGSSGIPADSPETIYHRNTPYTGYFELSGNEVEILVQVASFKSFNSGIVQPVYLGSQQAISTYRDFNMALDGALAATFFTLALYIFGISFQRRGKKELRYFAFYGLAAAVFVLTHSERLLMLIFPGLPVLPQLWVEDNASILILLFFSKYVYYSFPAIYPRKVMKAIEIICILMIVAVMLTSASYNGPFIYALALYIILVMGTNSFYMLRAARSGVEGASYLTLGAVCMLVLMMVNVLNNVWRLEEHFFLPLAQPIFMLSQALFMSLQYTNAYRTIESLMGQLAQLDKLKDEFLAKTSHELKTPLNGIINISQYLLDGASGGLSPVQQEDVRLMRDIGRRLSSLVHDILDYSKMKNQQLMLSPARVDCYTIVNVVAEMFSYMPETRKIAVINKLKPGMYFAFADENRLMQIIYNLVDNALKYTPEGSITISGRLDGGQISISVEDTGIGIAPENRESVFQSFEQLEAGGAERRSGVGLGLTIVRQLVELHGGTVWLNSEVGVGTKVTFTLPVSLADQPARQELEREFRESHEAAAAAVEELSPKGSGPYRILIVDDEFSNRKILMNVLAMEHYRVTAARSGREALELIAAEGAVFDLCIIDVMMPGLSGYEVSRMIRHQYTMLELPVLLVTALSRPGDLEMGFAAGANDYLEKPYELSELKTRVRNMIQLKASAAQLVQKEMAFLQAQIKPHFLYNTLNTILSLSYTDTAKSRKLLMEFSTYLRNCFDFKDAAETVSLEKEMELVLTYLSIERERFGDLLEVEIDISPETLACKVPTISIQPLVENAILHGVMRKEDGGCVSITARMEQQYLYIEVADNGVGMNMQKPVTPAKESRGTGVGMANISQRLQSLYGTQLQVHSVPGTGTKVWMLIRQEEGRSM